MNMTWLYLFLTLLFSIFQGIFSGLETGLVSVLRPRAEHAAEQGGRRARMLAYFLRRPGIMIATALIGVNISVVLASLMAKELFRTLDWTSNGALTLGSMALSVLMLFFEILPKNWFRENACARCTYFAPLFFAFYVLLWLPVQLFSAFTGFLSKLIGRVKAGEDPEPNVVLREDFRLYLRESQLTGSVDAATVSILDHAMDVPGMLIRQIAEPREKVLSIPSDMTIRQAFGFCQKNDLTKVPIHAENGEWVAAFSVYDAIYSVDEEKWDVTPVIDCAVELYFIGENLRLGELLERLRFRRIQFFVVLDGKKKQTGILRPEDLAALLFEN